jgi:protease I
LSTEQALPPGPVSCILEIMPQARKRIAILVDTAYQEMELWVPYYRFLEAGAECVLVGAEAGKTYTSKLGYPATAQLSYDAVSADDFDGVIVPGGYAPDHIRRHAKANQFVRDMDAQGKLVAAICHAGWVLCSAGILKGRRATCFFAIKDDLVNAGARYEDAEVVVDQNLVTSRKPDDLPAFCRASLAVLAEAPVLTA